MTKQEQLHVDIKTLNMFALWAKEGTISNSEFEWHCQDFIDNSGLELGDAEAYIELAIERANSYR